MLKAIKKVILSFCGLIIIWQIIILAGDFNSVLFPAPKAVLEAFKELFSVGLTGSSSAAPLLVHIKASMGRFLIGYLSAAVLGVVLGIILGWFPKAFAYVNPIIQLIRPIAPVAWLPFIVLWIGIGNIPAIAIIFIAGFFPILLSSVRAVQDVDPVYLKVAANFNLSQWQTVKKIVFPEAFPSIAGSLHLAISTCWIFLVSGEMVGAQSGLGFLIMDAKNCIRADALLATMVVIGVIGLLLDFLIGIAEKQIGRLWGVRTEEKKG